MQQLRIQPRGLFSALAIGLAILLLTGFLAGELRQSGLYSGSRFLSVILSQDTMELRELVSDRENVETLLQFVGAVTAAYIDFELIPLGEADTFSVVFQSRPPGVRIDSFAYHGEDLSIFGTAPGGAEYDAFVRGLTDSAAFESVAGSCGEGGEDGVPFEIVAVSPRAQV
jgi:hypothetical protein